MPALAADLAAGTRRARIEIWSDAAVKTRYPSPRDGSDAPAEGMFDSAVDGQTAIAFRGGLFGTERGRYAAEARDLLWPDPASGIPIVQLIDAELAVNRKTMAVRIELDLEAESTRQELFG